MNFDSVHLAEGLEMGYVGVDFVLDADLGPVVLEDHPHGLHVPEDCDGTPMQAIATCSLGERLTCP